MNATLNCDGSLSMNMRNPKKNRRGGYAFWLSCDIGKFKIYGRTPDCNNPMAPELIAIAKGIHFIRRHKELQGITNLLVQTDCLPAINWIVKPIEDRPKEQLKKHKGSLQNKVRQYIMDMKKEGYYGLPEMTLNFKHVPSHSGDLSESRRWVNDWLDKKAKSARYLKVGEFKQE